MQNNRKDPHFFTEPWAALEQRYKDAGRYGNWSSQVYVCAPSTDIVQHEGFPNGICFPVQPGFPQAGYTGLNVQFASNLLV